MSISQEEIDRQERELRSQLESALRKHGYYSPEEIDEVMKTFKYFGLKAIDQLKHISKEQLIEKGIPTVTATILKEEFSGADDVGGEDCCEYSTYAVARAFYETNNANKHKPIISDHSERQI
ncbi:uncharacterized protein LOC144132488 isoform X2 [Amblyomma americanum]